MTLLARRLEATYSADHDSTDASVIPLATHPVPVPVPRALGSPLMAVRADQPGDLRFHQGPREHADALPQHIPILPFEELANERRQIHSGLGHRRNTSVSSFSG